MAAVTLRARYVFPATGEPIADGEVVIDGSRIQSVSRCTGTRELLDLGNVAILPGLVNCHTHLEFSGLQQPLGRRGVGFVDWIEEVLRCRPEQPDGLSDAVGRGLRESVACGTTTLGEIAQPGFDEDVLQNAALDVVAFLELIAPTLDRVHETLAKARQYLSRGPWVSRKGFSPHAPYTVHPALLKQLVSLSAAERVPVAMHLAESREEIELLRKGDGPLAELLARRGARSSDVFRGGLRPLDYLRVLSSADRALVIHGNYLDAEELSFLAANADRMAVVYCPRTHAWFEHAAYPLAPMLAAGVRVALGTDSRASNPDLSILEEARFIARHYPQIPPEAVLRLATLDGAMALGSADRVGSLEPGKEANLAVVALPDREAADPYELVFGSNEPVVSTWHRGRKVN
jgi:cytosine/adenosine deaminase-related metal-dependent hydrolase